MIDVMMADRSPGTSAPYSYSKDHKASFGCIQPLVAVHTAWPLETLLSSSESYGQWSTTTKRK